MSRGILARTDHASAVVGWRVRCEGTAQDGAVHIEHFRTICELIRTSDEQGLAVHHALTGLSGEKLVGLLQRVAAYEARLNGGSYLEVGVYQGLSLISTAMSIGTAKAFGIDNFSQFDTHGRNLQIVQQRMRQNAVTNATIINMDYEDAMEGLAGLLQGERVGTFFVDGPHDYRSQLMCLQLVRPHLTPSAVIVVDDCNYRHVRLANRDFLVANPDFKLLFESYTRCHPSNMSREEESHARRGWWNGVNVIARDPENVLATLYPPTLRARTMQLNEHVVQTARCGVLAPEAVGLLSAVRSVNLVKAAYFLAKLAFRIPDRSHSELIGKYFSLNTFSEALPYNHYNQNVDPPAQ